MKSNLIHFSASLDLCPPPEGFGARHTQAFVLFICLTVAYSMRSHLSVTVVAMTESTINRHQIESSQNNVPVENFTLALSLPNTTLICEETSKGWSVYRVSLSSENDHYRVPYCIHTFSSTSNF